MPEISQAPPSLLGEQEKPPPPAPLQVNPTAVQEIRPDAFTETWVRAFVSYIGSGLSDGFEWFQPLSGFELAMIVGPLTKCLNKTAPAALARAFPGLIDEDDPTPVILAVVILAIAARRLLAWRKHKREVAKGRPAPKTAATAAQRPQEVSEAPPAAAGPPQLSLVAPEGPPAGHGMGPEEVVETVTTPAIPAGMTGQPIHAGVLGDGRTLL
jgi:hypothetical protein